MARKSWFEVIDRKARVAALGALRVADWRVRPLRYPPPRLAPPVDDFPHVVHQQSVPIWREGHPLVEQGKAVNVALAAASFDGVLLEVGRPLSFWRTLGRTSAARGYRLGRELRGGCVVPALGGGICLLSTALFQMAAKLGFTILERHGHSQEGVAPGPGASWGLDATVFHPHIDLVVAPREGCARLEVRVRGGVLRLRVRAAAPPSIRVALSSVDERIEDRPGGRWRCNRIVRRVFLVATGALVEEATIATNRRRVAVAERSCLTCGETTCRERPDLAALGVSGSGR